MMGIVQFALQHTVMLSGLQPYWSMTNFRIKNQREDTIMCTHRRWKLKLFSNL